MQFLSLDSTLHAEIAPIIDSSYISNLATSDRFENLTMHRRMQRIFKCQEIVLYCANIEGDYFVRETVITIKIRADS